jgi:hypothetical protein
VKPKLLCSSEEFRQCHAVRLGKRLSNLGRRRPQNAPVCFRIAKAGVVSEREARRSRLARPKAMQCNAMQCDAQTSKCSAGVKMLKSSHVHIPSRTLTRSHHPNPHHQRLLHERNELALADCRPSCARRGKCGFSLKAKPSSARKSAQMDERVMVCLERVSQVLRIPCVHQLRCSSSEATEQRSNSQAIKNNCQRPNVYASHHDLVCR